MNSDQGPWRALADRLASLGSSIDASELRLTAFARDTGAKTIQYRKSRATRASVLGSVAIRSPFFGTIGRLDYPEENTSITELELDALTPWIVAAIFDDRYSCLPDSTRLNNLDLPLQLLAADLGAESSIAWVLNASANPSFNAVASSGVPLADLALNVPAGHGLIGRLTHKPWIHDLPLDEAVVQEAFNKELVKQKRWMNATIVPIFAVDSLIGALSIYFTSEPPPLTKRTAVLAKLLPAFGSVLSSRYHNGAREQSQQALKDGLTRVQGGVVAMGFVHDYYSAAKKTRKASEDLSLQVAARHMEGIAAAAKSLDRETQHLQRLVRILDRVESGGSAQRLRSRDLGEDLRNAQEILKIVSDDNAVLARFDSAKAKVPELFVERLAINLVHNSQKHNWRNKPIVVTGQIRDDRWWELKVVDEGRGIESDALPLVRLPFFSRTDNDGLGLGLYIVQTLVDGVRGEFQLTSEFYAGTTAVIRIPLVSPN